MFQHSAAPELPRRRGDPRPAVAAYVRRGPLLARAARPPRLDDKSRHDAVTDLARDVHFQTFEQPAIERVVGENTREMTALMGAPGRDPRAPRALGLINRLVWSPQPMRFLLLDAWRGSLAGEDVEPASGGIIGRRSSKPICAGSIGSETFAGSTSTSSTVELAFAHYSL